MEMFQVIGLCLISTIFILIIKNQRPELAIQISIITGVMVLIIVLSKITIVVDLLLDFTKRVNIDMAYITIILKIIGIAYIAEFAAEICKDAGESAIASKIEMAGKVIIILMAAPVITSLLDLIVKIMP